MPLPSVGAQLLVFSSRYDLKTQSDLILDAVAGAGYAGVEAIPEGGAEAAAFREKLDARALVQSAAHVLLPALADLKPLVEYLRVAGGTDLCNSGLMTWDNPGAEDYRDAARLLNKAGRELAAQGIRLHYHNHEFEFQPVDGARTGMDLLLEDLDPEWVGLCIDVAWVERAGRDAAGFLRTHRDRIDYLHFKDFNDDGWIELGQGKVNFPAIMDVLPELSHVGWVIIEQDSTRIDPVDSVAISRAYLRDTFGY